MNIGYIEALEFNDFDCVVFHDVDHLAVNVGNYYGCENMPKHFESGWTEVELEVSYIWIKKSLWKVIMNCEPTWMKDMTIIYRVSMKKKRKPRFWHDTSGSVKSVMHDLLMSFVMAYE